jgi:flagellar biosynthesis protein FlhB
MSEEKTEQPTGKRLDESRKEGKVAQSQDLSSMLVLFLGLYLLTIVGPGLVQSLSTIMSTSYGELGGQRSGAVSYTWLRALLMNAGLQASLYLAPWVVGLMVVGVGANLIQTKGLVQPRLLIPKWSKLNPLNRAKQIFGKQALVELAKGLAKQTAVGVVVYLTLSACLPGLVASASRGLAIGAMHLGQVGSTMALQAAAILLFIAVLDYAWQRHQYKKGLMMTKNEVKEEHKQAEGSPETKGRIKRIQREMAARRMMAQVPKADVVVVNPTHYAVALQYDNHAMEAPTLVAKGQDQVALHIIKIARRHGVPVVPNRPLARALFQLPLDAAIPPEFFQAVAEVLAFVYSLRPRIGGQRRPAGR